MFKVLPFVCFFTDRRNLWKINFINFHKPRSLKYRTDHFSVLCTFKHHASKFLGPILCRETSLQRYEMCRKQGLFGYYFFWETFRRATFCLAISMGCFHERDFFLLSSFHDIVCAILHHISSFTIHSFMCLTSHFPRHLAYKIKFFVRSF